MPVKVCAASVLAIDAEVDGKVIVVLSVPDSVKLLLAVRVLPFAIVKVADVAGAVKATLFTLVAVATPKFGVTKVGVSANTSAPDPVSSVTADAKLADDGVAKKVATPDPSPETPVEIGKPVQFVSVPDAGVPRSGVTSDGEVKVGAVPKTSAPDPVSSVTADAKLADDGVAKKVPTLAPSPETPVEIGKPVQFVSVPDAGTPSVGVVNAVLVNKFALVICLVTLL